MLDEVFEKMGRKIAFSFEMFGMQIDVPNTLFISWITMLLIVLLCVALTRRMSVAHPGKAQVVAEMLVDQIRGMCRGSIGHLGDKYVAYLGSLILFLGITNMISLINFIPGVEMYPPTKDINVTGALAIVSILVVFYSGFRYKGFVGWLKSLCDPMALMAPFKILEYVTKPLSLCLRLFGNIVAGFIIMELLYSVAPILASPFSAYFDLFDGVLQAFIFVYLTAIYIGEAVE